MPARILLVEDDIDLAVLLQYNLEAAGYEVEHVDRGDAAEKRIAERQPDLLLLDWMIPGISGLELCRRVRRNAATSLMPIIMLTARAEKADCEFAAHVGASDFLTKPFSVDDVLARTRTQLGLQGALPSTP